MYTYVLTSPNGKTWTVEEAQASKAEQEEAEQDAAVQEAAKTSTVQEAPTVQQGAPSGTKQDGGATKRRRNRRSKSKSAKRNKRTKKMY